MARQTATEKAAKAAAAEQAAETPAAPLEAPAPEDTTTETPAAPTVDDVVNAGEPIVTIETDDEAPAPEGLDEETVTAILDAAEKQAAPAASTAPLDPPTPPAPAQDAPTPPSNITAGAEATLRRVGDLILDAVTGQSPDPDDLFERITPIGNVYRATKRLVKETHFGWHKAPTKVLLVAAGSEIGGEVAAGIIEAVRAQVAPVEG